MFLNSHCVVVDVKPHSYYYGSTALGRALAVFHFLNPI
jgi:hypothetical protein